MRRRIEFGRLFEDQGFGGLFGGGFLRGMANVQRGGRRCCETCPPYQAPLRQQEPGDRGGERHIAMSDLI